MNLIHDFSCFFVYLVNELNYTVQYVYKERAINAPTEVRI